ncbi:hypothetical protein [Pseudovibrio ascidiaceicola]|uniref:hypothetical protein n=1 Tax=Pseudovibrio ascidiaceicola TaxID=285279 RepID=UPI000B1214A3|nr:hypothetical protein [Pseudovibrio ascidiaceicola]
MSRCNSLWQEVPPPPESYEGWKVRFQADNRDDKPPLTIAFTRPTQPENGPKRKHGLLYLKQPGNPDLQKAEANPAARDTHSA